VQEIFATEQIGFPILSLLVFLPILGAFGVWMVSEDQQARKISLGVNIVLLFFSLLLIGFFVRETSAFQFVERLNWIPPLGISYHVGVDGISLLLVVITILLSFLVLLYSWGTITEYVRYYILCLLILEGTVIGVFVAMDLFMFFLFWEVMLIPMYFLIRVWGVGARRDYAAMKFMVYTLTGSVLMLIGMAILYMNYHEFALSQDLSKVYSFDLLDLLVVPLSFEKQIWVFIFFFFAFAFKGPMVPFHTWFPDALKEGPIAMGVILAGIKLGAYGFIRFSLPLLPEASVYFAPLMMVLSLIAIIYGALIALIQTDIRGLLAYSSISHLGFVTLGLFALNYQGIQGGLLQMINLGITTSAFFLMVGFLENRIKSREISEMGGLVKRWPVLTAFFFMVLLSSLALPGTNVFIGEFLILWGAFMSSWWYGAFGVIGVILAAAYLIWYFERSIFGPLKRMDLGTIQDLGKKEFAISLILVILIFWIGVYPSPVLRLINGSVGDLTVRIKGKNSVTFVGSERGQKELKEQILNPQTGKTHRDPEMVLLRGAFTPEHSPRESLPLFALGDNIDSSILTLDGSIQLNRESF
jgi:NADH-quinone oxidoreductase subunit M